MRNNTKPVIATKDEETLKFNSITECAKALGVTPASVSISIKEKWKVRGYIITPTPAA